MKRPIVSGEYNRSQRFGQGFGGVQRFRVVKHLVCRWWNIETANIKANIVPGDALEMPVPSHKGPGQGPGKQVQPRVQRTPSMATAGLAENSLLGRSHQRQ